MKLKVYLMAIAVMVSAIALIAPQSVYILSLWQNLAFHALWVYLLLGLWSWFRKNKIMGQASFASFALVLVYLWPYLFGPSLKTVEGADFKVTHFNVLKNNQAYQKTIDRALRSQADFISFQEVDHEWVRQLQTALSETYPHHKHASHDNPGYGIAVFSKYPLQQLEVKQWTGIPSITGDILLADRTIHFITAHTQSPISESRFVARNHHLQQMAKYLHDKKGLVLAVGDFNAVPWDTALVDLRQEARLRDSRSGLTPTFPAYNKWARIPIDYILHSKALTCLNFQTIAGTESDHLGITGAYKFND